MALGSTRPLVKMSTRNIPGGKGGRCVRLMTSPPSCAEYHGNLGAETSCKRLGHTGPVTGLLYLYLLQSEKGTQWGSWYSHCATSLKVAGPIPYGVIGIFH